MVLCEQALYLIERLQAEGIASVSVTDAARKGMAFVPCGMSMPAPSVSGEVMPGCHSLINLSDRAKLWLKGLRLLDRSCGEEPL